MSAEWQPGPDGTPYRRAARVIPIAASGRVLLVLGHDFADTTRRWWFTVGGGIGPDEDPRAAAARELYEETGIRARPDDLEGPVLRRYSRFEFVEVSARQDEVFYLLRLEREERPRAGEWTELERDVLDELAWWDVDELAHAARDGATVYPPVLPELVASWIEGWDGTCPLIDEVGADAATP
ncbi:NUDIX domain-containing protein [Nanchangia anserum]|uniref:NUDIX domain-containing protein n=1 Tax=Nanchangia anserum TaxID=2692125 RepID=A0A8I0KVB3_9ACTO|nr:NUDIX domain-containing protein [Nanchangia anserum]QOX82600.1 NUDIX domain-containing protein [Nanchangia anserum]